MASPLAFVDLRARRDAIEKALLRGFTAGEYSQALTENPYPPGTTENCAWDEAWKMGAAYRAESEAPPAPL